MRSYIIATHGNMAKGIYETLAFFINTEHVYYINCYSDEVTIEDKLQKVLENINEHEEVMVFTDMRGGSVSQTLIKVLKAERFKIIAGVNLPLILEIIMTKPEEVLSEKDIKDMIDNARNEIEYLNTKKIHFNEDDEV